MELLHRGERSLDIDLTAGRGVSSKAADAKGRSISSDPGKSALNEDVRYRAARKAVQRQLA
jgi:hypothetical protein